MEIRWFIEPEEIETLLLKRFDPKYDDPEYGVVVLDFSARCPVCDATMFTSMDIVWEPVGDSYHRSLQVRIYCPNCAPYMTFLRGDRLREIASKEWVEKARMIFSDDLFPDEIVKHQLQHEVASFLMRILPLSLFES